MKASNTICACVKCMCMCMCACVELSVGRSLKVGVCGHAVHIFKSCLVEEFVLFLRDRDRQTKKQKKREREGDNSTCVVVCDVLVSGPCGRAVSSGV